jgi:hypothetical protein
MRHQNCERQIRLFSGTLPGDRYIFVVFDWTTGKPIIKQIVVIYQQHGIGRRSDSHQQLPFLVIGRILACTLPLDATLGPRPA